MSIFLTLVLIEKIQQYYTILEILYLDYIIFKNHSVNTLIKMKYFNRSYIRN
jgi:hypothetical protein